MSDVDFIITSCAELERVLKTQLNASGNGLAELARSVEDRLPSSFLRDLRTLARIRNLYAHGGDKKPTQKDASRFRSLFPTVESDLQKILAGNTKTSASDSKPEVFIHRIWADHLKGKMVVHLQCYIGNAKDAGCRIRVFISDHKGNSVIGKKKDFTFKTGQFCILHKFTPTEKKAFHEDIAITLSLRELKHAIGAGSFKLIAIAQIWVGSHREPLATSPALSFTFDGKP